MSALSPEERAATSVEVTVEDDGAWVRVFTIWQSCASVNHANAVAAVARAAIAREIAAAVAEKREDLSEPNPLFRFTTTIVIHTTTDPRLHCWDLEDFRGAINNNDGEIVSQVTIKTNDGSTP